MDSKGIFDGAYHGRRVLVTGHTGFKGGWLSLWLRRLGAEVHGLALPVGPGPSLHELIHKGTFRQEITVDIRDAAATEAAVARVRPDFIFHLAAQPLVRESYGAPVATVETNVLGTVHLLDAVRRLELPCHIVVVTSDKCYENRNWCHGYRETDPLGGHDVYSASKAAGEILVAAWRSSFFEPNARLGHLVTARGGNVIGGGDFARDRIIPDSVRSLSAKKPVEVRNPQATRPWQHVLDCLSGYLWYGAALARTAKGDRLPRALNFGPLGRDHRNVRSLVEEFLQHWPGKWEDRSDPSAVHEAGQLQLSIDLSAAHLHWQPTWGFSDAVQRTAEWYRQYHQRGGVGMKAFTLRQIAAYEVAAAKSQQAWARRAVQK